MIPTKDSLLVDYSTNFNAKITATGAGTTYQLTASQISAYTPLHTAFINAYNALAAARESGTRSAQLRAVKDQAKVSLLHYARQLYSFVQENAAVLDSDKIALGVLVKKTTRSPIPPPATAPALDVKSVTGWTASVWLKSGETESAGRGKPLGVAGAAVFSFVGAAPPTDLAGWKFEGNTGKTRMQVQFDNTLAAGTKVWLTAQWFNNAKQAGPACDPVSTNLPGGGVTAMAA